MLCYIFLILRSLASEWGRYGMRFNCIAPGPIITKVGSQIYCKLIARCFCFVGSIQST